METTEGLVYYWLLSIILVTIIITNGVIAQKRAKTPLHDEFLSIVVITLIFAPIIVLLFFVFYGVDMIKTIVKYIFKH